jgi:hypothetical protein
MVNYFQKMHDFTRSENILHQKVGYLAVMRINQTPADSGAFNYNGFSLLGFREI